VSFLVLVLSRAFVWRGTLWTVLAACAHAARQCMQRMTNRRQHALIYGMHPLAPKPQRRDRNSSARTMRHPSSTLGPSVAHHAGVYRGRRSETRIHALSGRGFPEPRAENYACHMAASGLHARGTSAAYHARRGGRSCLRLHESGRGSAAVGVRWGCCCRARVGLSPALIGTRDCRSGRARRR
jgi:hypothetical protein